MIETLVVVAAVVVLGVFGVLGPLVPPDAWLLAGAAVTGIGLLTGVPAGLWYHVALYRCLRARCELPSRWWLHPVALHPALREGERRAVLTWFTLGGLGFGVVVLGCALVVFGLALQWLAPRPL